jgi:fatty-acyl-CoA synthase
VDRQVRWAAVHADASRMATVPRGDGIGRGSRVGLLAGTGVELITALQAVWLVVVAAAVTALQPARRRPH